MAEAWIDELHRFWFEELRPEDWFAGAPETDETIRRRFGALYETLKVKLPATVTASPKGCLAAVIALDQFPRNLFRRSREAYATDAAALAVAQAAVAGGFDRELGANERYMLYMPFMHSEDRSAQQRSVALFADLGMPEPLGYAQHHKAIIDRFGRFPHRNALLDRPSTSEEIEYLKAEPSF